MKKYISILLFLLFTITFFVGCNSSSNEDNNDNQDNTPTPPVEEDILPTDVEIDLYDNWLWDINEKTSIDVKITPSSATNQEIEWNFSNPKVAHIDGNDLIVDSPGKTTITATTCNGISATVEFEVRQFFYLNFECPLYVIDKSYSNSTVTIRIDSIRFYKQFYYNSTIGYVIYFEAEGVKISDTRGENHRTTTNINFCLYDKDNYVTASGEGTLQARSLIVGDKFKNTMMFYSAPYSGAPYTLKWVN